jgi:hypothetical protein
LLKQYSIQPASTDLSASPSNYFCVFDDMAWSNPGLSKSYGPLTMEGTQNAGGGISTAANTTNIAGRYGAIAIETGTTSNSTGQGFLYTDTGIIYAGSPKRVIYQACVRFPTLADVTNDYVAHIGAGNQFTAAFSNNAVQLVYKRSVSTNWMAYTSNNGSSTSVTTADSAFAVVANTDYTVRFDLIAGSATFYVAPGNAFTTQGALGTFALLGSSVTNLPDVSNPTNLLSTIYRASTFALRRQCVFSGQQLELYYT